LSSILAKKITVLAIIRNWMSYDEGRHATPKGAQATGAYFPNHILECSSAVDHQHVSRKAGLQKPFRSVPLVGEEHREHPG